jgi:hypothetical protein
LAGAFTVGPASGFVNWQFGQRCFMGHLVGMSGLFVPEIKAEAILEKLGDHVQMTTAKLLLHVTPNILIKVAVVER